MLLALQCHIITSKDPMHRKLLALAIASALTVAPLTASADPLSSYLNASPSCAFANINSFVWGTGLTYVGCSGSYSNNNVGSGNGGGAPGSAVTVAGINTLWGGAYGPFVEAGTTNAGQSTGPFSVVPSGSSGMLQLPPQDPLSGYFVIALKSSTNFSLYLLEATAPVSQINFKTDGTSLNKKGIPQGLSHATLYTVVSGSSTTVPEPSTYVLLGAGLVALGGMARRKKA